jgi:hypothetical protein
VDLSQGG